MAILDHIRSSISTRFYANGSLKGTLSNRGNGLVELIMGVKILNVSKNRFLTKISGFFLKNSLEDQWAFWNI